MFLILWICQCWHVNVQSCLLILFQYQPISLLYSWLSVEQPFRCRLSVLYASLWISNTIEDNSNNNTPYVALIIFYSDHSFHHHSHCEYFISYLSIDALARVYGNSIAMVPAWLKINNCLIFHVLYFAPGIYISLSF